jgi:phospholipase C
MRSTDSVNPIQHVVVVLLENHSFDNVFGPYCNDVATGLIVRSGLDDGCDGATQGQTADGATVSLTSAPDRVPAAPHAVKSQVLDIDGGKMDGWNLSGACVTTVDNCLNEYQPLSGPCTQGSCIPNLVALADRYSISDRTFELTDSPSWGGHLELVTGTSDRFTGEDPSRYKRAPTPVSFGIGWGCDSGKSTYWTNRAGRQILVPSCIPDSSGSLGPNWAGYSGLMASHVPTVLDRLDTAGLTWRLYAGAGQPTDKSGWAWAICPSFAECMYSSQRNNLVPNSSFASDAASGNLPAFSIVTPANEQSEHNGFSMSQGDNFLGQLVSQVQSGSDWASTAIFITYDDCGCFYDHVDPLQYSPQWGVRIPTMIVSPFAKAGYTDSNPTTFAGILHYVEETFQLPALGSTDATAYDYQSSFCYQPSTQGCTPAGLAPLRFADQYVPPPTRAQLAGENAASDDDT